jgi:membrane protein YdbS with pleckstrin-like domain
VPYCNQCGASLPEGARFCQACGTAVAGTSSPRAPSGPIPSTSAPITAPRPTFASLGYTPIPTPPDLPFHPQSDEVILREIIPHPRLRWRIMLSGILGALVILVFVVPFVLSAFITGSSQLVVAAVLLASIFGVIVVVSVVFAFVAYRKFRYWITNQRTVGRRGVIGYSIDSIPLETISDVVVQRSVADRILGMSTLYVQPFGGSSMGGYGAAQYRFGMLSGTNSFLGLTPQEAPQIQQMIFHLRDVRRRETGRLI